MFKKTLLVAVLIVASLVTPSTAKSAWALPTQYMLREPDLQRAVVEGYLRYYFGDDAEIMIAVGKCESTGLIHLNPNGSLRRNPETGAAGAFQVMLGVHASAARLQKLDINHNLQHYIRFVHHLYEADKERGGTGLRPWQSSAGCWSRKVATILAERVAERSSRGNPVEVAQAKN